MYDQRHAKHLCNLLQDRFYRSKPWRTTRKHALLIYGAKCQCCGTLSTKRKPLHVDHIKPRSKFPELALCMTNLQILCEQCNGAKSNTKIIDYRTEDDKLYASMYNRGTNVRTILIEQKQGTTKPKVVPTDTSVTPQDVGVCNNKKKNPNTVKDTRTKKQRQKQAAEFRNTQRQFLDTIRTLKTATEVTSFVGKCEEVLGSETTRRLVALCNISHKLDR